MKYQNFKGDFTVVETFTRDGAEVPVPYRVVIHYFTKKYAGIFTCERDGDTFRNCRLSADGMSLICSVALSRKPIGMGLLCHNVIEVAEDENFPDSEQHLPIPEVVISDGENVMIYEGPSDNTNEIISAVVLSRIINVSIEEASLDEIDALFEVPDLDPVHIDQS
jgi:hypothetical protein